VIDRLLEEVPLHAVSKQDDGRLQKVLKA